jgi:DNA invertase Pin-like site-specific DNA recombinase
MLLVAGCERIFAEKISGRHAQRPELLKLLDYARSGDVVVVTRLDRFARNIRDLLDLAEKLNIAGIGLKSLAEPWADTTSAAGKFLLVVLGGVADFERSLIVERTSAGRQAAIDRGVAFGRPKKLNESQAEQVRETIKNGMSCNAVAKALGISKATVYRILGKKPPCEQQGGYKL